MEAVFQKLDVISITVLFPSSKGMDFEYIGSNAGALQLSIP